MGLVTRLAALALGVAVVTSVSACGDDPADDGSGTETIKVGLITKFPGHFYDILVDAAKHYDADYGDVEVIYGQGKSGTDDAGVIAHIENMITQQVKAIAITPTSPNVRSALDKAVQAGIKVVLIDNDIPGWTGKSAVVATDNLAGGKLAGKWIADKVPAGGKIGILQGRLGNPSLDDRVKGLKKTLGNKFTVVGEPTTDCDQAKGLNAAQDLLTANPDVKVIYGACGPPILGALQALKAAGKKAGDVVVVGFDALADEITAIVAGDQSASVAQFPSEMGALGIDAAVRAARGETVDLIIDTGTEMVTKDNADKFK